MGFEVVTEFIDLQDKERHYRIGDAYPRQGYEPSEKRIKELSSEHKKLKKVFIKEVKSKGDTPSELLTEAELKKMNKEPQENLIKGLGGEPSEAKNEEERINLILELQAKKQNNSDLEKPSSEK
jgi:hypothetical protein